MISHLSTGDEFVTPVGCSAASPMSATTSITLEIAEAVRVKVQKTQVTQPMPKGTRKSA